MTTDPNVLTEPPNGAGIGTARAAQKTDRERRRALVSTLLASHLRYDEIAAQLGVSHGTVASDVAVIRKQWQARYAETYDAHVAEELAKLDALERRVLPKALTGGDNNGPSLWAVDRALAIMDRRARLLGLDKPLKVTGRIEVTGETVLDRDIRVLIEQMQGIPAPADAATA